MKKLSEKEKVEEKRKEEKTLKLVKVGEEYAIIPKEPEIVAPADMKRVLDALKRFEDFKSKALSQEDYVVLEIRGEKRPYIKKSGWMKYALACGISLQMLKEKKEVLENGETVYHYVYRAIAPNGRFCDAVGSASTTEREFAHEYHDVRALAQTRAANRAVSMLIGGGEVSYEEMIGKTKPTQIHPQSKEEVLKKPEVKEEKPQILPTEKSCEVKTYMPLKASDGNTYGSINVVGEGELEVVFDQPLPLSLEKGPGNWMEKQLETIKAIDPTFQWKYEWIEEELASVKIKGDSNIDWRRRIEHLSKVFGWVAYRSLIGGKG